MVVIGGVHYIVENKANIVCKLLVLSFINELTLIRTYCLKEEIVLIYSKLVEWLILPIGMYLTVKMKTYFINFIETFWLENIRIFN